MSQDEALVALCAALLQDPKLVAQAGWQKLVLIGEVHPGHTSMFGYTYNQDGEGKLTSPSLDFDMDRLDALHQAMKAANPNGRGWLKCMIRLSRAGEVGADFEYDNPKRWEHTTDNYLERIREYATLPV